MIMEGCQGKPQISIMDKICPQCGHESEVYYYLNPKSTVMKFRSYMLLNSEVRVAF